MASDFAPLFRSIWSDDDFRALSVDAQHAYLMLMSHPDRNSAGVLSLTAKKWTRLSADLSRERLMSAMKELDAAAFIVTDEDTEEVLVRAYIRRAKVYTHIRMLANALREASEVESDRLRSALGQELVRLPRLAVPSSNGRNDRAVEEAHQVQARLDEVVSRLCDSPPEPPGHGLAHGMGHGMADGMAHPPVVVAGAVAGAVAVPGPSSKQDQMSESDARARHLELLAHCYEHPGQLRRNCRGCAADRKAAQA